ncbi:hypothetical protein [Candidatus Pelagibacter ubique]|uniref:hypothetical protein n=1 Tax=Pelagibacter ubique TaxID=198252 RepID=UPI0003C7E93E
MKKLLVEKVSDKLVNAFLKNKTIPPIPKKFTKKLAEADKFRKLCENKIKEPVIGFKVGGTGISLMKKLKEKELFYASVYKKKYITSFGDLSSDFGRIAKFLIGQKKKYKRINIENLKANIANKKTKQNITGNTNAVYINPLSSLRFVLNKIKKDKTKLNKDFYVFTGSTVGAVLILGKGLNTGKIEKLGSVKTIIS